MLRVNYSRTRLAANKLNQAANACKTSGDKAHRLVSNLPAYWNGVSAESFLIELNRWIRENNAIKNELNNLASDITRITYEFEEAEKKIVSETLKSNNVCEV